MAFNRRHYLLFLGFSLLLLLLGLNHDEVANNIIFNIRLPQLLAALLMGMAVAQGEKADAHLRFNPNYIQGKRFYVFK